MSIDVFGVFQKKEEAHWRYIKRVYYGHRDGLTDWLGCFQYRGRGGTRSYPILPITDLRDLPVDLALPDEYKKTIICLGDRSFSWLLANEILGALPVLGIRTHSIPVDIYQKTWECEDDLERWKTVTGLGQEYDEVPLVGVSSRPESASFDAENIPVDCVYDFSHRFEYFIDEVREIRNQHGEVRFVYGFA